MDADISALTPEQLALELEREAVRIRREERKGIAAYWRGSLALLRLMWFIAVASASVLVIGGLSGDPRLILPALAVLSGSGGGGVLVWRLCAKKLGVE